MTQKSEGIICPRQPLNNGCVMIGCKSSPLLFLEFILLRVMVHVSLVGLDWIKPQLPTVDQ